MCSRRDESLFHVLADAHIVRFGKLLQGGERGTTLTAFYAADLARRQTFDVALTQSLLLPQYFDRGTVCLVETLRLLHGLQAGRLINRAFELLPAEMDVPVRPVDERAVFVDLEGLTLFFG